MYGQELTFAKDRQSVFDARFGKHSCWRSTEWWPRQGEAIFESRRSTAVRGQDDGDLGFSELFRNLRF